MKKGENYRKLWFFDILDNIYDWRKMTIDSEQYKKIPRWMYQAKMYYLPSAKSLGPKYYKALNRIYKKHIEVGLRPRSNNFQA
jgi:hypothetical protein